MLPQQRNVRRSFVSQPGNSQQYADPRIHSNPQPIPQNPGLNPNLQRAANPAVRNFHASPAQSPQQHAQQYQPSPSRYPATGITQSDMNPSYPRISASPSTKSQTNGQYGWQSHPLYGAQPHPHQMQPPNAYQALNPMATKQYRQTAPFQNYDQSGNMQGYNYSTPGQNVSVMARPHRPSTTNAYHVPPGNAHTPMQGSSATYFTQQTPPQFYPNQIPTQTPSPSFSGGAYGQPMYSSNQQAMQMPPHGPRSMSQMPMQQPQQQQQQQQQSQRKKVVIKDPNTLRDVTDDILQPGSQSESSSISGQSSTTPIPQPDHVKANFAAQVAVLAGGRPSPSNLPPQMGPPQGDIAHSPLHYQHMQHAMKSASPAPVPAIPSGVDITKPPPSLVNMPLQIPIPPGSSPMHTTRSLPPMQTLSQFVPGTATMLGSSPKTMQVSNAPPHFNARHDAPVAIVQPQPIPSYKPSDTNPFITTVKTDTVASQKIEEILSTTEAIRLEHAKSEHILQDIVSSQPVKTEKPAAVEMPAQDEVTDSAPVEEEPAPTDDGSSVRDTDAIFSQLELTFTAPLVENLHAVTSTEVTEVDDEKTSSVMTSQGTQETITSNEPASMTSESQETVSSVADDAKIVEEREDIPVPDNAKIEVDSSEKASTPLSSGDSAVNETIDKVPPKTPEGEMISEQEQVLVTNKEVSQLVFQARDVKLSDSTDQDEKSDQDNTEASETPTADAVSEEQPLSESGKKVYGREFLLQFRFHSASLEKPIDLPPIDEIIMDRPPPKSSISSAPPSFYRDRDNTDFAPSWMRGGGQRGGRQSSRGSRPGPQRQGYGGGFGGQMGPPKVITKSIQKEPELNKAENAWKPSKMEAKPLSATASETEQTEEILKNVRAILNKLTPQKFNSLMQKIKQLPINTESRLREVINLVFEKAIDEPNFCETYANMCCSMSQFKLTVPTSTTPNQAGGNQGTVEFRKVLLTRCQHEFEKVRTAENKLIELRKKVEEAKTPKEKQQYKEELDYAETKDRRRMLGNIRFIGELFKLGMLTETIMHNCLMTLFRSRDEESLESLCRLLTTIGKTLDHPKGKQRMDQYFTQIEKIVKEKKTSSRVRFMLKDVVDLRLNNWVPRAIKAQGPKTIDQIHQDAKDEKEQKAAAVAAAASVTPVKNQSRGGRMGSRGNHPHGNQDEGWTKVQKPMRIDPQKMKFSKFDESNVTLGPPRGKQGWKSGSGSSTTRTGSSGSGGHSGREPLDAIAPRSSTPTTMNRFSALGGPGNQDYTQRGYGKVSSQERTRSDSRGSSGSFRGREEKQSALDIVRKITSSEKKAPSASAELPPSKLSSNLPEAKIDVSKIVKKIESIIKEYLCIYDVKEACACIEELNLPSSCQYLIVKTCLEISLEKSSGDRDLIAKLLGTLVKSTKIHPDQYLKGVSNNMELAIDLEIDLPKVWSCLAEQIGSIFYESGGKIQLRSLKEMTRPLLQANKAHLFVAEILKKLVRHMNADTVVQYWKSSNLTLDFFMKTADPSEIMAFAEKQGLEDFYSLNEQKKPIQSKFDRYLSSISKQLNLHKDNERVVHWIEENISPDEKLGSDFVRALTTAVCDSAIKHGEQNVELDKEALTVRAILLKRYINDTMELQALYGLQRLYVTLDQPPNIIKPFFNVLYDADVISERTFLKWKEEDNPEESEGKGVAILSATSFFTWLQEEEDAESDE